MSFGLLPEDFCLCELFSLDFDVLLLFCRIAFRSIFFMMSSSEFFYFDELRKRAKLLSSFRV